LFILTHPIKGSNIKNSKIFLLWEFWLEIWSESCLKENFIIFTVKIVFGFQVSPTDESKFGASILSFPDQVRCANHIPDMWFACKLWSNWVIVWTPLGRAMAPESEYMSMWEFSAPVMRTQSETASVDMYKNN
jgi:hypothetical protein